MPSWFWFKMGFPNEKLYYCAVIYVTIKRSPTIKSLSTFLRASMFPSMFFLEKVVQIALFSNNIHVDKDYWGWSILFDENLSCSVCLLISSLILCSCVFLERANWFKEPTLKYGAENNLFVEILPYSFR